MAMTPRVALVTGAPRGIGRGIAIELARLGFSIAINYAQRHEAALECKRLCAQAATSGAHAAKRLVLRSTRPANPLRGVFHVGRLSRAGIGAAASARSKTRVLLGVL